LRDRERDVERERETREIERKIGERGQRYREIGREGAEPRELRPSMISGAAGTGIR
jgi:hypothetical protein